MTEPLHVKVAPELYERMRSRWSEPVEVLMGEPDEHGEIEMRLRKPENFRVRGELVEVDVTLGVSADALRSHQWHSIFTALQAVDGVAWVKVDDLPLALVEEFLDQIGPRRTES